MKVTLIYQTDVRFGGWATYTVHLARALRASGCDVRIARIRTRDEKKDRDFGYGETYQNISPTTAVKLAKEEVVLTTAVGKNYYDQIAEVLEEGGWITIHDPNEIKTEEWKNSIPQERCFIIRTSMQQYLPGATFIRHPFDPYFRGRFNRMVTHNGVAISRIDFDKRTHWILEANRLVAERLRVRVMGEETRQYTFRQLCPKFPEFIQNSDREEEDRSRFPRVWGAAQELCRNARLMVDLSEIKGDGGGTQYTFLEAIDAGAVCVLNKAWIRKGGVMVPNKNCLAVGGPTELAELLRQAPQSGPSLRKIRKGARKLLVNHAPRLVGRKYKESFDALF